MKVQSSKFKVQSYSLKFKVFKLFFVLLIFNFSLLTFHLSEANAQQVSLAISPPLLELVIKPGKSVLIAYKLENRADPLIASAKVLPFRPQGNLGNIKIEKEFEGPIRFNLDNSEIKFEQPFFMKSGYVLQLLVRIRVPEGSPEGDYYYTLLTETQPPPSVAGSSAGRAKATIGSNILITVSDSGRIDVKGKIALFDVLAKLKLKILGRVFNFFESSDKIPVVLVVGNQGNNLIKPQGSINLRGNFGEQANYQIISQNILSNSERLTLATPSAELNCQDKKPSDYCKQPVSLLLSGFFIGHYTLSANVSFGQSTPNLYASTSFIALPLKLIFGIVIALFIGLLIVKKFTKTDED